MNSSRIAISLLVGISMFMSACYGMAPVAPNTPVVPDTQVAPDTPVVPDTQVVLDTQSVTPTNGAETAETVSDIEMSGFAFAPAQVTVKVGTTVIWTNNDSTAHTTTSDDGEWDSENLAPGQSYSHTFTKSGSFAYHCKIHGFMTGTIVVTE